MMYTPQTRFTPIGEYLRLVVLRRLREGPASIEEIEELTRRAVEALGIKYDWRVWPRLVEREVELRGDTAVITPLGRQILEITEEEVAQYVKKRLGVEP